jgi:hypothetical protein
MLTSERRREIEKRLMTCGPPTLSGDAGRELLAEIDRLNQERDDLLSLIVQPWLRDGDGAHLFKVNIAWWDTAQNREEAIGMVREVIERRRRITADFEG